MTQSVVQRVESGGRWLDRHRPGWLAVVDLDRLDMSLCTRDVVGQLWDGLCYCEVRQQFGARLGLDAPGAAVRLGLVADPDATDRRRAHAALTRAWKDLIAARKATL